MGFDNFRINVVLRVLVLLGTAFVMLWGLLNTDWQVTPFVCAALLVLLVLEFIHYVELGNRQFANFLSSVSEHDFSTRISAAGKGKSFAQLASAYNLLTEEFRRLNSERAAKHQLLEALIEHVSIALLCIDENGKIILMNQGAKNLFNFPYIHNASALRKVDRKLPDLLASARAGENQLIRLRLGGEELPLSMFTTRFDLVDSTYTLVSFQNIRDELERREIDSWQKLIKVLTHEIMNSVTPIVALTTVIKQALVDDTGEINLAPLTVTERADLARSLVAIEARGKGLVRFVQSYTNLANPPPPFFTDVSVYALLERVSLLMGPELDAAGISLLTHCEPHSLSLRVDAQQIEQVLINLVKNAREALANRQDGRIRISCALNPVRGVQIVVSDNGPGIEAEQLQDIFIPFYTTRKEGSGIGLSISRQITIANQGQLQVTSAVGSGTEFTLTFRHPA
jgi:nitrogen fixation/metabolism regulation signal transduction histidine kinase